MNIVPLADLLDALAGSEMLAYADREAARQTAGAVRALPHTPSVVIVHGEGVDPLTHEVLDFVDRAESLVRVLYDTQDRAGDILSLLRQRLHEPITTVDEAARLLRSVCQRAADGGIRITQIAVAGGDVTVTVGGDYERVFFPGSEPT